MSQAGISVRIRDKAAMEEKDKKNLIKIGIAIVIVLALYYVFSPYQNCMRAEDFSSWCTQATQW